MSRRDRVDAAERAQVLRVALGAATDGDHLPRADRSPTRRWCPNVHQHARPSAWAGESSTASIQSEAKSPGTCVGAAPSGTAAPLGYGPGWVPSRRVVA